MDIKSNKVKSSLILEYKEGKNEKGKDIIKKQRFSKVNPNVDNEAVYVVGKALSNLIRVPVEIISRADESDITE